MKLWMLEPSDSTYELDKHGYEVSKKNSPWYPIYDCAHGFIVVAETERRARELASKEAGDEGKKAWLNPKWSNCYELKAFDFEGVVMRDFHAG